MFIGRFNIGARMPSFIVLSALLHSILLAALLTVKAINTSSISGPNQQVFVLLDRVSAKTNVHSKTPNGPASKSKDAFVARKKVNSSNLPAVIDARKKVAQKPVKVSGQSEKPPSKEKSVKPSSITPVKDVGEVKTSSSGAEGLDGDLFSLGASILDDPETISEVDYLKSAIERHRNFAGLCTKGVEQVEAVFEVSLNRDGSINFVEYLGDNAGDLISEQTRRALIDHNLRAIELASPFKGLDASRYSVWRKLKLKFTQH